MLLLFVSFDVNRDGKVSYAEMLAGLDPSPAGRERFRDARRDRAAREKRFVERRREEGSSDSEDSIGSWQPPSP